MLDLNFFIKLIRLTKTKLTIETCCVKIPNCTESFETRQELRQGDVLHKHLWSSYLSRQTKFTIHKNLIRPVLLYGSETWVMLTKREENQLLVFERKVLWTICGPKIENGVYSRRYNHELNKYFNSPNAQYVTKTSRLRYAGHMIRRPEDLPQKALFRPNGRRHQGRPKSRWADGVNSDSLALRVRDWTHCAQDRQSWRDLLQLALVVPHR
jgi:hypothetical protein